MLSFGHKPKYMQYCGLLTHANNDVDRIKGKSTENPNQPGVHTVRLKSFQ